MARTPTTAVFGDVFTSADRDDGTLIYLPAHEAAAWPWLDTETDVRYATSDIDWDVFKHTHQLIPADGGGSDA